MMRAMLTLVLPLLFLCCLRPPSPEQKPVDGSGENAGALKNFQYAAWFVLVFSISAQVQERRSEVSLFLRGEDWLSKK